MCVGFGGLGSQPHPHRTPLPPFTRPAGPVLRAGVGAVQPGGRPRAPPVEGTVLPLPQASRLVCPGPAGTPGHA